MADVLRRTGLGMVGILSLGVAAYAIVAYRNGLPRLLDPNIRASFEAHTTGIMVHVFGAMLALLLGPFQFVARLRNRQPRLHRCMGRVYLGGGVLIGGSAGMYMSFFAFGGLPSQLGFGSLAIAWLFTGTRAYTSIRAGDAAAHRRWMIRNFALSFAAVTLRLYIPASVISGVAFATAYPAIAWLCWVPNLLVAEWIIRRSPRTRLDTSSDATPA